MLRKETNSYYGSYIRNKAQKPNDHEMQRLMTDRAAYLSYLEVQLERVSAACLVSQGFSERIEQQQSQIYGVEEKIVNLAKMIRLTKAFQEEEGKVAESGVSELAERINKIETDIAQFVMDPTSGGHLSSEARASSLLSGAAANVAGLTKKTPLQVLKECANNAAQEALEGLPVLEQINQLSKKYSDHSLNIANVVTDKIKLQDRVSELDQRVTQLTNVIAGTTLSAEKAEENRNQLLEERLLAFEGVVERKLEASISVLRVDMEKKMNNRWEYIEGKISNVEAKLGGIDSGVQSDIQSLKRTVTQEKEEMKSFVERAVQAQQAATEQNTKGLSSLRQDLARHQTDVEADKAEELRARRDRDDFEHSISNTSAQLQAQVDELQRAILALESDLSERSAASAQAVQNMRQSVDVNAETIKATTADVEASHQATIDFVKAELEQIREDVGASVTDINKEVTDEILEIHDSQQQQQQLNDNMRALLDGVRTQVSENTKVCQTMSEALEELHVERRAIEGKFVDSLVDLAEKQETEQAATTQQIQQMRTEIQNHIATARAELQNSIQWLGEHDQRKRREDNSDSSSSEGAGGPMGSSTKRFKDPRASLEKLSDRLRREKQKFFTDRAAQQSAAAAWREASRGGTGDSSDDAEDSAPAGHASPPSGTPKSPARADDDIPVVVTLHQDNPPHTKLTASARERQIAADKRRARATKGPSRGRRGHGAWR